MVTQLQYPARVSRLARLTFVVALAFSACMPVADPDDAVEVDPNGVDTGIEIEHQEGNQLCWAAVEQGVLSYAGVKRSQCEIVSAAFHRQCCSNEGFVDASCNGAYYLGDLQGFRASQSSTLDSPDRLASGFVTGSTYVLRYVRPAGAHFMSVTGYGRAAGCERVDQFAVQNSGDKHPKATCVTFGELVAPTGVVAPADTKLSAVYRYELQR